jgi:sugar phosphate isomerase/epimerase
MKERIGGWSRRAFLGAGVAPAWLAFARGRSANAMPVETFARTAPPASPFPFTADQIRERLGISLTVYHFTRLQLLGLPGPLYRLLENIKAAGIPYLDIPDIGPEKPYSPYRFSDLASMRRLGAACRAVGLRVCSFHSGLQSLASVDAAKREVDLLAEFGGRVWLAHLHDAGTQCLYDPRNRRGLEALARHCEGSDIRLTVENLKPGSPRHDLDDLLQLVNAIDHPRVGITIDIGHCVAPYTVEAFRQGMNPMTVSGKPAELFRKVAARLNHVHLHDQTLNGNTNAWQDHHAPFTGRMQWLEIFRALHEIKYQGIFLFETTELFPEEPIETTGRFPELLIEASRRFP